MLVSLYNSALISWNLLYLGQSFDYPPPWEQCKRSPHFHRITNMSGKERDREMGWLQELLEAPREVTRKCLNLRPLLPAEFECLRTVPFQYFWYHTTLQVSSHVEEGIETLVLNVALCLFAIWVSLCIILIIRIKISVLVSVPVASFLLSLRTSICPEDRFRDTPQCPQQVSHGRGHSYLKRALDGTLWSPSLTPTPHADTCPSSANTSTSPGFQVCTVDPAETVSFLIPCL